MAPVTQQETLAAVRVAARQAADAGELPGFLAELERLRVEAVLATAQPVRSLPSTREMPESRSRLLTVQQTAKRLGRSRWWVYRHKATLPVTRLQTGGFGFDEKRLEQWIAGRTH
jgi:predicted DNA-binding transcriptional regulator AlpA